jgi:hypothetical protein
LAGWKSARHPAEAEDARLVVNRRLRAVGIAAASTILAPERAFAPKNDNVTLANFLEKQGFADHDSRWQATRRRGDAAESHKESRNLEP